MAATARTRQDLHVHCLKQSKTHLFSAEIQQIVVIEALDNEPILTIFNDHNLSVPLIISLPQKRAHKDDDTGNEAKPAKIPTTPKTPTRSGKKPGTSAKPRPIQIKPHPAAKKKNTWVRPDDSPANEEEHHSEGTIESDST
ncbi:hypothetical protein M407DRAFT_28533 [Tulasnella calospora MUT 4182]|uniref:Uncharacterized protein n=1 Tax=Tulasnella calospora MUT 4182 TaxID=1051891 RepID=A0A0C3LKN5_9AGAM|nr:hypothetical protein M407DRAFT_28533 [Tulasnella calospora MUT 4182]